MLTHQSLTNTERHGQTSRTIWNYATGTLTTSKGLDSMINRIALSISTVEKCTPKQVVKQPEHGKASNIKVQK